MGKVKGFKGFDKEMKCQGFQFEVGKTYEHMGEVKLCNRGFHFCENPLDTLDYYNLFDSRYAEVEAEGVSDQEDKDSKRVAKKITIKASLDLPALIKASFDFLWQDCQAENLLDKAKEIIKKAASGDSSQLAMTGADSVGAAIGIENKIKGAKGCWITLAEWENKDGKWRPLCVKSIKVDGKKIKADVWYQLKKGKFVAV